MRGLALGLALLVVVLLVVACVRVGVDVTVDSTDPHSLLAQYSLRLQELCASGDLTDKECEDLRDHLDAVSASMDGASARALGAHTEALEDREARGVLVPIVRRLLRLLGGR